MWRMVPLWGTVRDNSGLRLGAVVPLGGTSGPLLGDRVSLFRTPPHELFASKSVAAPLSRYFPRRSGTALPVEGTPQARLQKPLLFEFSKRVMRGVLADVDCLARFPDAVANLAIVGPVVALPDFNEQASRREAE